MRKCISVVCVLLAFVCLCSCGRAQTKRARDTENEPTGRVTGPSVQAGDEKQGEVTPSGHGEDVSEEKEHEVTPIPDVTAPVLTVEGDDVTRVIARSDFQGFAYSAEDETDGELTGSVRITGEVDPYLCGTYVLHYEVTDRAGNCTTAERTVEVVQPEVVRPEGKAVYLTFDDGPGNNTEELLAILEKYDVKATFFVCGTSNKALLKKIADAGHTIGAHCMRHVYEEVYASDEAYFEDLNAILQLIYESTGVHTTLIRFPGGSSNMVSSYNEGIMTRLTKRVEELGFQYIDWNVSSADSGTKDTQTILHNMIAGIEDHQCSIVLTHPESRRFSFDAVEDFICYALENGYTFYRLEPTSPRSHHRIAN